ncbi:hypothetical protein [Phormidium sp. FACHB-592]|nr:hypothetical protein [Phormidium sp. FACHB-592]
MPFPQAIALSFNKASRLMPTSRSRNRSMFWENEKEWQKPRRNDAELCL